MAKNSGGNRMEAAVKLVFMFFVSLLSFSVGTFVGKGFSDSEYMEAALEKGEYKNFDQAAATEREETLTEEDITSLTDEFVENEKRQIASHGEPHGKHKGKEAHKDAHGSAHAPDHKATDSKAKGHSEKEGYKKIGGKTAEHHEPAAAPHGDTHKPAAPAHPTKATPAAAAKPADAHREVARAATRVAEGKAPTPEAKPTRQPDSVLPSVATSSVGKYTVQVAAYMTEDEARNHAARLKAQGFSAFYIPAQVKEKTWYRVSVGLFATSEGAQEFKKDFMRDAKVSSALVQKIVK